MIISFFARVPLGLVLAVSVIAFVIPGHNPLIALAWALYAAIATRVAFRLSVITGAISDYIIAGSF
jgi:hypothetical protein